MPRPYFQASLLLAFGVAPLHFYFAKLILLMICQIWQVQEPADVVSLEVFQFHQILSCNDLPPFKNVKMQEWFSNVESLAI